MDRRQVGQLDDAGAGPGAIAFVELDLAAEHAAGAVVRHDVDDAGGRRLDLQRREPALRAIEIELRLRRACVAWPRRPLRPRSGRTWPSAALRAASARRRRPPAWPARTRASTRGRACRDRAWRDRGRTAPSSPPVSSCSWVICCCAWTCAISASDCFSSDCFSCIRWLQRGRVELDEHVAGLHRAAVLGQLDDLQLAGLHRRRQHDRLRRAGCRRGAAGSRRTPP